MTPDTIHAIAFTVTLLLMVGYAAGVLTSQWWTNSISGPETTPRFNFSALRLATTREPDPAIEMDNPLELLTEGNDA